MFCLSLLLVLPLLAPDGGTVPTSEPLDRTSQERTKVSRRETPTLLPPYLRLPVFVDSRQPLVEMEYFSPAKGTGKEPLPETVRGVLLPVRPNGDPPSSVSALSVKTSCKRNKMHVQVERSVVGTSEPQPQVRLGTCRASRSTTDHLYFEYDLDMCGTKRTMKNNQVTYSNTLQYDPPRSKGLIRRAAPFTLPVACYYNRYQYSYKIGYTPKLRMRKILKPMKNSAKFILTPRNAQWERLSPSDQYMLGQPMYFEAEALSMPQDKRLYVRLCYATPKKSHTSTPQFPVVQNFGCMVESKDNRSRFIPYKTNAVRFSVDAFLFKGMTGKLFMHCSMFVGSSAATTTTKSCNFDTKAKRWVELYGPDSVCACCDSNCSSAATTVTKIISSRPWTIKPKVKPTTAPRRKAEFTTTTTTTTTAAPQTETSREVTKWRVSPQPEEVAVTGVGKVENTVDWPIRGGGVMWLEVEGEEKEVKGSAVVEEKQQQEEEEVSKRRTIFEDIFDFDD